MVKGGMQARWTLSEVGQRLTVEPLRRWRGVIIAVLPYGFMVDIGAERPGLVHLSEISDGFVVRPSDAGSVGDSVDVRVIRVDVMTGRMALTMRQALHHGLGSTFERYHGSLKELQEWGNVPWRGDESV